MSTLGRLKLIYLLYFAKPRSDRQVFRAIRRRALRQGGLYPSAERTGGASSRSGTPPVVRILELGVGSAVRAQRLIALVARYHRGAEIRYTGVDMFEAQAAGEGQALAIKAAYCQLRASGAKVRLLPGEPSEALSLMANHLGQQDLVLISAGTGSGLAARQWFYLPRIVHRRSMVFLERDVGDQQRSVRLVPFVELTRRAEKAAPTRKAA